jgi:hypothetical protein
MAKGTEMVLNDGKVFEMRTGIDASPDCLRNTALPRCSLCCCVDAGEALASSKCMFLEGPVVEQELVELLRVVAELVRCDTIVRLFSRKVC